MRAVWLTEAMTLQSPPDMLFAWYLI